MQQERKSLVQELLKSIDQVSNNLRKQNHSLTRSDVALHEFQWFELDNKIRILVHELIEPHLKGFVEQRCDYNNLSQRLDKYIANYEDFKALYFQNGKGTPLIQQLRQQMLEFQQSYDHLQQTALFTINENNRKLDSLQFLKDQQFHQLKMIESNQTFQNEQIEKYRIQNQEFKQLLLDNLDQVKRDSACALVNVHERLQQINMRLDTQDCVAKDLKVKISNTKEILHGFEDKLIQQFTKLDQNALQIEALHKKFPKLDDLLAYDRKVGNELTLMKTKLKYFENYIEKYFPLFLQGTLSETLHNCLNDEEKYKLAQFEEDKFTELHKIILNDDGNPNLDRKITEYTSFIEKQLKRNMSFIRDRKASPNKQSTPIPEMEISSKMSQTQQLCTPKSLDSSERVGVKGEEFRLDRNEIEQFLQNKFIEFKEKIEKEVGFMQSTAVRADESFHLLHEKMIQQFEQIKHTNTEQMTQLTQQMIELVNQYGNLPLLTQELSDVQQQQQQSIQKLLQCSILSTQLNQEEIQFNGQIYNQEQGFSLLNSLVNQMKQDAESEIYDSPIKRIRPQLITEDQQRKSIRIKTASQSGLRKSIYSQSQTRSATEKRKLYLLGSKIQQELCQSLNDSVLNPRRTNAKLLFQSKANRE